MWFVFIHKKEKSRPVLAQAHVLGFAIERQKTTFGLALTSIPGTVS